MTYFLKYIVLVLSLSYIDGAFRCDYRFSKRARGWFKSFIIPATWFDARLRCALEGAELASPSTPALKAEMIDIMNSTGSKFSFFTGIHAFSPGDFYTVDGVPLAKIPATWVKYEPNNMDNNEHCMIINKDGDLADRNCMGVYPYICYRPYSQEKEVNECGTVDPEYEYNKKTRSCYKFHKVPRIYNRASFACSAEGGHLAIINSDTEAEVIRDLFAKYPGAKIIGNVQKEVAFIGFHDWTEHGEYRTIHGQTLDEAGYSKFAGGEPNNANTGSNTGQFCGGVFRSALLIDHWCDRPVAFICEKKPAYPRVCHVPLSVVDEKEPL